jgi:exonuclease III
VRLRGDGASANAEEAAQYMEGFSQLQKGHVGDMTAGLPPADYVQGQGYFEWYAQENGRVVIELEQDQIELLSPPIPAIESDPISREEQNRNMAAFLGSLAREMNIPAERAICVGGGVVAADKRATNNKIHGMKLLTKELRKELPPLYSQDGKGGKAVAYVKFFTPDSGFTWWITEGSPIKDENGNEVDFHFFGLVEGQDKELGYVSLSELENVHGPMGLPIERDLYWQPKTLEEIAPEMFRDDEEND